MGEEIGQNKKAEATGETISVAAELPVSKALTAAYGALSDLLGEVALLRRTWEQNPQMAAMAAGVNALRQCIAILEALTSGDTRASAPVPDSRSTPQSSPGKTG